MIDWEGSLGGFLYDLARRHGEEDPGPARALRERWEALQFELVQDSYRPYRGVLAESLRAWMGERGYGWSDADGEALARSMESWQPFPDTVPALSQAREAGLRLVIVSNTDRSIVSHTLRQLEVAFDEVLVAEDCRAYKPALEPFLRARDLLGDPPEQVLHVAFGFKYDIGPAKRVGFRTAWVNRKRERRPGPERPDWEWDSLWGLAELAQAR